MRLTTQFPGKVCLIAGLSFLLSNGSYAQNQRIKSPIEIKIGDNIQLNQAVPNQQLLEPHISAHPSDPTQLLAVGWVWSTSKKIDLEIEHCAVFASRDGGQSWKRSDLSGQGCSDAWITATEQGGILTFLGSHPQLPDSGGSYDQTLVHFSNDGGISWSEVPQSLGFGFDGPRSTLAKDGTYYVSAHRGSRNGTSIYLGGARQDRHQFVEKLNEIVPSNLNKGMNGIATLSDGTIVIIYGDFQRYVRGARRDKNGRWRGALEKRREWLISTDDRGKTFSFPKMITESCFDRANGLAVDKTEGEFKDRLYSACGGDRGKSILFMYSEGRDKGDLWSDATPVELPTDLKGERKDPHIAVNKDGVIAVAWLDSRDKPGQCFTPYVAVSTDGGNTFTEPTRVGSELSCASASEAGEDVANSGRWSWGGDYFGLTAAADGRFHVLWPDARSGKFELMTASVTVTNRE